MSEQKKTVSNPLICRYPPNNRFIVGAFKDQKECPIKIDSFGESIVDKESYRLSLAGKRGALSTSIGSSSSGWYMFDDGIYNPDMDFSFLMRKDLTIVEIDEYIKNLKKLQEKADQDLNYRIENEISAAIEKRTEIDSQTSDQSDSSD